MPADDFPQHSFTHILVGDVASARERLELADTPTHRRELIRTVFSAIEGLHWQLKRDVFRHASAVSQLNLHEHAALLEETYVVDEKGRVRSQPKFLPLPTAIRLVVTVVKRYRPDYDLDFSHIGWSNLRAAVEVRNRLVHPKSIGDLSVSDLEVEQSSSAFFWLLALAIEVLRETNSHIKSLTSSLPTTEESRPNEDP